MAASSLSQRAERSIPPPRRRRLAHAEQRPKLPVGRDPVPAHLLPEVPSAQDRRFLFVEPSLLDRPRQQLQQLLRRVLLDQRLVRRNAVHGHDLGGGLRDVNTECAQRGPLGVEDQVGRDVVSSSKWVAANLLPEVTDDRGLDIGIGFVRRDSASRYAAAGSESADGSPARPDDASNDARHRGQHGVQHDFPGDDPFGSGERSPLQQRVQNFVVTRVVTAGEDFRKPLVSTKVCQRRILRRPGTEGGVESRARLRVSELALERGERVGGGGHRGGPSSGGKIATRLEATPRPFPGSDPCPGSGASRPSPDRSAPNTSVLGPPTERATSAQLRETRSTAGSRCSSSRTRRGLGQSR